MAVLALPLLAGRLGVRPGPRLDCLLVAYDQGDLDFLAPVAARLAAKGRRVRLLGLGHARAAAVARADLPLGVAVPGPVLSGPRDRRLAPGEAQRLVLQYRPRVVLAGMASAAQAQILDAARGRARRFACYDAWDDPRSRPFAGPFLATLDLAEPPVFLVPTEGVAGAFRALLTDRQTPVRTPVVVTGNPGLEAWIRVPEAWDPAGLRRRLGLPPQGRLVLFVGGYEPSYPAHFRIFAQAARALAGVQVLVAPHPRTDGRVEAAILASEGAGRVRLLPADQRPPLARLARLADLVVCHQSSAGLQALLMGRPVLYVAGRTPGRNVAVDLGLAPAADSPGEVDRWIRTLLAGLDRRTGVAARLGLPADGRERVTAQVEAALAGAGPGLGARRP